MAARVRAWDRAVRHTGHLLMTVHPVGTPDSELPSEGHLGREGHRLVFHWPGPKDAPAARPTSWRRPEAGVDRLAQRSPLAVSHRSVAVKLLP